MTSYHVMGSFNLSVTYKVKGYLCFVYRGEEGLLDPLDYNIKVRLRFSGSSSSWTLYQSQPSDRPTSVLLDYKDKLKSSLFQLQSQTFLSPPSLRGNEHPPSRKNKKVRKWTNLLRIGRIRPIGRNETNV